MEAVQEEPSDNTLPPNPPEDNSSEDKIPNKGRVIFDAGSLPSGYSLSNRFEFVISSQRSIKVTH